MSRLILLSGVGGSGVSSLARATVDMARQEGLSAVLVDASGPVPLHPAVGAVMASVLDPALAEFGADPTLPEAWAAIPAVGHLSAIATAADAAEVDLVVLDAGGLARARELVGLPPALVRLLDSVITPRLAMWRSASSELGLFDSLSTARAEVLRLQSLLQSPETTVRLVTVPSPDAVTRTARALGLFAMSGVAVDGVIVNRFPRRSEGGSKADLEVADAALAGMREAADGVEVWKSTQRLRPVPKERSVLGPLGRVRVLDAEQLTVHVGEEELHLEVPLAGPDRAEASVGIDGDRLVVAFDGALRWIDLPPVLRRCIPLRAVRTAEGLRIEFVPDSGLWRQPAASRSAS